MNSQTEASITLTASVSIYRGLYVLRTDGGTLSIYFFRFYSLYESSFNVCRSFVWVNGEVTKKL